MAITLKLIAVVLLLCCVAGLGIAGTTNGFAIVDAVNAKLPANERFDPLGWWLGKTLRLHSEYRRLYPSGGLLRRQGMLLLAGLSCLLLVMALLGFGLPLVVFFAGGSGLIVWLIYFRKAG